MNKSCLRTKIAWHLTFFYPCSWRSVRSHSGRIKMNFSSMEGGHGDGDFKCPLLVHRTGRRDTVVLSWFLLSSSHGEFFMAARNKMSPRFSYSVNWPPDWSKETVFFLFLLSFSFWQILQKHDWMTFFKGIFKFFFIYFCGSLLGQSQASLIEFPFWCTSLQI